MGGYHWDERNLLTKADRIGQGCTMGTTTTDLVPDMQRRQEMSGLQGNLLALANAGTLNCRLSTYAEVGGVLRVSGPPPSEVRRAAEPGPLAGAAAAWMLHCHRASLQSLRLVAVQGVVLQCRAP
jgi:hypothetical protein